jgi:aminopeptidase
MRDIRIDRWADVLVNYALAAKPGQHAVIVSEPAAIPLVEACYEKLILAGTISECLIIPKSLAEIQFQYATDEQLKTPPPVMKYIGENCDLYLGIGAESNSKLLANFDPKKQTLVSQARLPFLNGIMNRAAESKMRWVYTHFPTPAAAQDAEMGTREYEEFVFALGHLNEEDPVKLWKQVESSQQKVIQFLESMKELHFKNPQGTDLRVNVEGMKWVNCCGRINFPDGEVYTGPNLKANNGGVNGVARLALPTMYRNVEVHNIDLKFENGAVVEAKASKGQEFLREMIKQDEGAKYVGEIAIGTNYNMNRITKNILFDEKFGGTFHFALGKGYPQTGNTNQSALHWDIIFDMRDGGTITADGKLFYENGKFTNREWCI